MAVNNSTEATAADVYDTGYVQYWEQIFSTIVVGLIAITGLIGNSMIILAVAFCKKLQTSTNVLVANLGVIDLLTSFTLIWYAVSLLGKQEWLIPEAYWICQATGFLVFGFIASSMWTLGLTAINRLLYIVKPLWYKKIFTSWKLIIIVMIPWVIPFGGFLIPVATGHVTYGYAKEFLVCTFLKDTPAYQLSTFIVALLFPLFAIFGSYLLIYVHIKKHFRKQRESLAKFSTLSAEKPSGVDNTAMTVTISEDNVKTKDNMTQESNVAISAQNKKKTQISEQEIKIIKNLFTVVVAFVVCIMPYFLTSPFGVHALHITYYTRLFIVANSAINIIIYGSKHPDFKVVLRHMMRCSYSEIPQPSPLLKYLLERKN